MYLDIHTHNPTHSEVEVVIKNFRSQSDIDFKYQFIGIHPWDIDSLTQENYLSNLETKLKSEKYLGIGEIGLDKSIKIPLEKQILFFKEQLSLNPKRIVIHSVKAYSEILEILTKSHIKPKILLHDFNTTLEMAQQYLKKYDCYFSFGAKIFNPKTKACSVMTQLPKERIFLETDDQITYDIKDIYKKSSEILNMNIKELQKLYMQNFETFIKVD